MKVQIVRCLSFTQSWNGSDSVDTYIVLKTNGHRLKFHSKGYVKLLESTND